MAAVRHNHISSCNRTGHIHMITCHHNSRNMLCPLTQSGQLSKHSDYTMYQMTKGMRIKSLAEQEVFFLHSIQRGFSSLLLNDYWSCVPNGKVARTIVDCSACPLQRSRMHKQVNWSITAHSQKVNILSAVGSTKCRSSFPSALYAQSHCQMCVTMEPHWSGTISSWPYCHDFEWL